MKSTHIYYKKLFVAFLLLTTALASCKKEFLEVIPKGKLIAQKVSDYDLLLSNLDLLSSGANAQTPMGDELAAVEPYFSGAALRTQRLFRWDTVIYEPAESSPEMQVPMQNIYIFNKIINEIPDATDGDDQQKQSIDAEARAGRAWTYFLLINYYGKPYNEVTSGTDPGFPIVTNADVTATKFTRPSVKAVYDFIINDLVTAIPNLPVQTTHRLRMARAAAEGLLGKVYMFMGKFNDALPLLNASLTDIANSSVPIRLYDYNVAFSAGGVFLPQGLAGPAYPLMSNNEENVFGKQADDSWAFAGNELVISPQTVALFKASDLRLKFYSADAFFGSAYPAGLLKRLGPVTTQFGVLLPDLYLLRAECKARLNDLTGAQSDVETLRIKRMPASDATIPSSIASQQLPLLKYIMDERIREFAVEGFRWFDMRRLSQDPLFSGVTFSHTVYSAMGTIVATYSLNPTRLTMQIPSNVMDQNPGLENNP